MNSLPKDLKGIVEGFASHTFEIGTDIAWFFYESHKFQDEEYFIFVENPHRFLRVINYTDQLCRYGFKYEEELEYGWQVIKVEGNVVYLQKFHFDHCDKKILLETIKRNVLHQIDEEDGFIEHYILLRKEENSKRFGPQYNDDGDFCPREILVPASYMFNDREIEKIDLD